MKVGWVIEYFVSSYVYGIYFKEKYIKMDRILFIFFVLFINNGFGGGFCSLLILWLLWVFVNVVESLVLIGLCNSLYYLLIFINLI